MAMLQLPSHGLTLTHDRPNSAESTVHESKQIIQLNLTDPDTKDILKAIRNNEQVRFKTGKKQVLQFGKRSLQLHYASDVVSSDLFAGPLDGSKPLYFSGRLSHTLEVQKAKEDTAKSLEALAALKNTLNSYQELRASNEASLVGDGSAAHGRKDPRSSALLKDHFLGSAPPSPYLSAGMSPALGPTSVPMLTPAARKEKIRLEAIRIPAIHLLAVGPMTTEKMSRVLNISKEDCDRVMEKIAQEGSGGKMELNRKSYRDLNVWKFPYKSSGDRTLAIDNATKAYDRMRLEKHDLLWQLLLPEDERGKNKFLSKLNFDKPLAPPKPVVVEKDMKSDVSDREGKAKKPKATLAKETTSKKGLNDTSMKQKTTKPLTKVTPRASRPDSKIKSAAIIENSDEEAESVPTLPAKAKTSTPRPKAKVEEKLSATLPSSKASLHKSKLSDSSSNSNDLEKSRSITDRSRLNKPETNSSRVSPRPRAESSSQKPSPLGSSPPTNSTDLENSTNGSTQSSAPSSPPSSTDAPLAQRRNYSPVVTGGRTMEPQRNGVKRKADTSNEPQSNKKQNVSGDRLSALPRGLTNHLKNATPDRRSSGSSLSSPEKVGLSKKSVVAAAKRFTKCYASYRELHEKLSQQSSKERDDKEIDGLWRMHERIEDMKSEIWSNWAKVSGGD